MKINIHTHFITNQSFSILNICIGIKKNIPISCYFSTGIHPWNVDYEKEEILWNDLLFLTTKNNCIAIGEIGLDKYANSNFELQKYFFEKQLILAQAKNLPIIIHCIKSFDEIFYFRKKYKTTPWIIHDFSGSIELARQLIKNNIYISLGNIFFNYSSKIEKNLTLLPKEMIFLETDNKFFPLEKIYHKTANILNISEMELENQIFLNFKTVFNGYKF